MRAVSKFFSVLFLSVFSFHAIAQQAWSLEKCMEYALSNSLRIKQAQLNNVHNRLNYTQSMAAFAPSVSGSATHNYNFGRTVDPFTNQFIDNRTQTNSFSLNSNVTVFNGFQLQNTLKKNQFEYLAGKYELQKQQNDLSLEVATFFLQVLLHKELVASAEANLKSSELQVSRTRQLTEAGILPSSSRLEAEAQLASDELVFVNALNQQKLSLLNLQLLLDLPVSAEFDVLPPDLGNYDFSAMPKPLDEIITLAALNMPEIKSSDYKIKGASKGLYASRGDYFPRLAMSASYGTGYSDARLHKTGEDPSTEEVIGYFSGIPIYGIIPGKPVFEKTPFRDQLDDNLSKAFGFNLYIPIANGLSSRTNVARSKIALQSAALNDLNTKNQLSKNVKQAYADFEAAGKKLSASNKSLAISKELNDQSEIRHTQGLITSVEFNVIKNNYLKARADAIQSKYEFIFKKLILDFYSGNVVKL